MGSWHWLMDMFLLSGMAGTIYYLSELANPEASCFPAFELWPANCQDWGWWRGTGQPVLEVDFSVCLNTAQGLFVLQLSAMVKTKTWPNLKIRLELSRVQLIQKDKGRVILGQSYRLNVDPVKIKQQVNWRGLWQWRFPFLKMNTYIVTTLSVFVSPSAPRSPAIL